MFEWEKIKKDSILAQLSFLEAIHRHIMWAEHTEDRELEKIHLRIAASIKQSIFQYKILLDQYPELLGDH